MCSGGGVVFGTCSCAFELCSGTSSGIMVFVFGLRLWSNLGLPFACPGYAPTGFEPMETYPGHAKGNPKLDHNLKPKTKTVIPDAAPKTPRPRCLGEDLQQKPRLLQREPSSRTRRSRAGWMQVRMTMKATPRKPIGNNCG